MTDVVWDSIKHSLAPLFAEARKKNLLFFSPYQELWFTPSELEAEQKRGRFRWGAVNWELRPRKEMIADHEERVRVAEKELATAKERSKRK